jgi:soluble lytic murein transglycosylase-like protein
MPVLPESAIFQLVQQESARTGIHPAILYAQIKQESGFDPQAVGGAGEQGLMQIKPTTRPGVNLFDPQANVAAGADYMQENMGRFGGDPRVALSAYNAGPTATAQAGGVHPSAQPYVERIAQHTGSPQNPFAGLAGRGVLSPEILAQHEEQLRRLLGGSQQMDPDEQAVHDATGSPAGLSSGMDPARIGEYIQSILRKNRPAPTAPIPEDLPPGMDIGGAPEGDARSALSGALPSPSVAPPPDTAPSLQGPSPGVGGGTSQGAPSGGTWKENLPQILGALGAMVGGGGPMGALGAGVVQGSSEQRISEWKEERKRKMDWENAQVEAAKKIYDDLQGLNLTEVLEAETDPEKRQLLQQATDRLAMIGKKWADYLSPDSDGGSVITPKEAADFMTAAQVAKSQIDRVRSKAADVSISRAGELEMEKYKAREAAVSPEDRELRTARAAAERARAEYYARKRDRSGRSFEQDADMAFVRETAKIVPMLMYKISRLKSKGDPASLQEAEQIQKEIIQLRADLRSAGVDPQTLFREPPAGGQSFDVGGGYTLEEDN